MRWIGQHIWEFITRFRNEVYLEDISAGTPNAFISVDSSKKIVTGGKDATTTVSGIVELATTAETTTGTDTTRAVTPDGLKDGYQGSTNVTTLGTISTGQWRGDEIATSYGGTGLTSYTQGDILYYDTSGSLSKLGIGSAGQVLKVNSGATAPEWGTDAAGLSFNGSTANGILTYGNSTTADVESNFTYDGTDVTIESTAGVGLSGSPLLHLKNTHASAGGPGIKFEKLGKTGADNDLIGQIAWWGLNDADAVRSFALVQAKINDASDGAESGSLILGTNTTLHGTFVGSLNGNATTATSLSGTLDVSGGGTGQTTLASNAVLTGDGTNGIVAESNLSYNGANLTLSSSDISAPDLILASTSNHASGSNFIFIKDRDVTSGPRQVDGDVIGIISFRGEDDAGLVNTYGSIVGKVAESSAGQEGGELQLKISSHDGELVSGLTLLDGDAEDEVDVTIGNTSTSLTTVAGDLKVTGNDIQDSSGNANTLPGVAGTLQHQGAATGQHFEVLIKDFGSYLFYLFYDDNWYSAGSTTIAILSNGTSPSNLSTSNSRYGGRIASYTAVEDCTLKKLTFTFYWTSTVVNAADIDFAFSKYTPVTDGSSATTTMNAITATDCNGSYTENVSYQKTFTFSGGNASLSAGDCFAFHMRTTGATTSQQRVLVYGTGVLSIELD